MTKLDLSDNNAGDAGAQALARNNTLKKLYIDNNNVGDAGAQALAVNSSMIKLKLGNNNVGSAGAQALARNSALVKLDLSYNNVGDAGAQALARNRTLTELALYDNNVGDVGTQALLSDSLLADLDLFDDFIQFYKRRCYVDTAGSLKSLNVSIEKDIIIINPKWQLMGGIPDVPDIGKVCDLFRGLQQTHSGIRCPKGVTIRFMNYHLGNHGFQQICESLSNVHVIRLDVRDCGVSHIPFPVQHLRSLTDLYI